MNGKHKTKLDALIASVGMSMTDAAILCGVNVSQFSLYVRGARPSRQTAAKIARGLGVEVAEIWPEFGPVVAKGGEA
jgi:lambda repressor-like predicted transcriptional regulator